MERECERCRVSPRSCQYALRGSFVIVFKSGAQGELEAALEGKHFITSSQQKIITAFELNRQTLVELQHVHQARSYIQPDCRRPTKWRVAFAKTAFKA